MKTIKNKQGKPFFLDSSEFLESINKRKIVYFEGFNFCDPNLIKQADKIKKYFTPLEKHRQNISALITSLRKSCEIIIGLLIQHGDHSFWRGGKYFYDIDSYVRIMERLKNLFQEKDMLNIYKGAMFFYHAQEVRVGIYR